MADVWGIFAALDENKDGTISCDELKECAKKGQVHPDFAKKWLAIFDEDGDGVITMEEFESVLGLKPRDDYVKQVKTNRLNAGRNQGGSDNMTADKLISDGKMSDDMYNKILEISQRAIRNQKDEYLIAEAIKKELDNEFGRAWHVLISRNAYSTFISYEEASLVQFKMDQFVIQVWKTLSEIP